VAGDRRIKRKKERKMRGKSKQGNNIQKHSQLQNRPAGEKKKKKNWIRENSPFFFFQSRLQCPGVLFFYFLVLVYLSGGGVVRWFLEWVIEWIPDQISV
jgi:hypothetical protein